jgi:hypothetical protein
LIEGILLADSAQGESHVDEHPVTGFGKVIGEQAQIDLAAHSDHVN